MTIVRRRRTIMDRKGYRYTVIWEESDGRVVRVLNYDYDLGINLWKWIA